MKTTYITRNDDNRIVAVDEADNAYVQDWLKSMRELEPGEMKKVHLDKEASQPLTAWHIILCKAVFAAQDRFTDFRAFRQLLYTMSGHCVEVKVGRKVIRVPGSWSWEDLDNDYERSDVHKKVVLTMQDPLILRTLWPHLKPAARMEMMLTTIAEAEAKREQHKAAKAARAAAKARAIANKPVEQVSQMVGIQACRPEDRAMLATPAGAEMVKAAVAQMEMEGVAA